MHSYLIDKVKTSSTISPKLRNDLLRAGVPIVTKLIAILPETTSYCVTADLISIIAQIGGDNAFKAIKVLMTDVPDDKIGNRIIIQSVLEGLGHFQNEEAINMLLQSARFSNPNLRYTSIKVLEKWVNQNFLKDEILRSLTQVYHLEDHEKTGTLLYTLLTNNHISVPPKTYTSPISSIPTNIQPQEPYPIQNQLSYLYPENSTLTGLSNHTLNSQKEYTVPETCRQTPVNDTTIQSIREKLLNSEDNAKLELLDTIEKNGFKELINELITIIKTSHNRFLKQRASEILLKLAPHDNKLRFLILEHLLEGRVIGQHNAKIALGNALRIAQVGLKQGESDKPIGSFIFLGPTGVGKTELAKALTEVLYGSDKKLVRIDMAEYTDLSDKNKLIGSPPGFVGSEEGGQLTQAVLKEPQSVVLFDEVEKAHTEIFNLFLALLDDGRLTDSKGVTVSFKETIVIMTSNIGSQHILEGLNNQLSEDEIKEIVMEALKDKFRPEFLNRFTDMIIFRPLTTEELYLILDLKIKPKAESLASKYQLKLEITPEGKKHIIDTTQKQEFGFSPRELNRIIDEEIIHVLSEKLLDMEIIECYQGKKVIPRGGTVHVTADNGKINLMILET